MSWKKSGCYVWTARKPHALFGWSLRFLAPLAAAGMLALYMLDGPWPLALATLAFSGRHVAYVGETSSRFFRDRQHRYGDSRYGAVGKDWMDLAPRVYPLPCLFPRWKWARKAQEKLYIFLLLPVYNTQWNKKNPRRITPTKAQIQRWGRDARSKTLKGRIVAFGIWVMRTGFALCMWIWIGMIIWTS